jgi:hypothetical protein
VLIHGLPSIAALKKGIKSLHNDYYLQVAGRWLKNQNREAMLIFIDFIDETCTKLYTHDEDKKSEEEKDLNYLQSYNARFGLMIFILTTIYSEYKVLSPERSVLFKNCLSCINKASLDEVEIDKKIVWLRALSQHLYALQIRGDYDITKKLWVERGMYNPDELKAVIDLQIAELEIKKHQPSFLMETTSSAISSGAQYAVGMTATRYAAQTVLWAAPAIGGFAASAAAGPLGIVLYGGGTLVATSLGRLVADKIVPSAVANFYGWMLDKMGAAIGRAGAATLKATVSVTGTGLVKLLGIYKREIKDNFAQDYIDMLFNLPDEVMAAEQKNHLRKLLGMTPSVEEVVEEPKKTVAKAYKLVLFDHYQQQSGNNKTEENRAGDVPDKFQI